MTVFFENPLMLSALLAGLSAAIVGGTVGTFVVVKRISFISGSISHSVLAGIGLFLWLERTQGFPPLSPLWGALLAAIASALFIARAERTFKQSEDSVIATVWAAGMALGIVLIAKTPGYTTELSNVLIGNILWVSRQDVIMLASLAAVSMAFIAVKFQQLKLLVFDTEEARLQGIPVERLYSLLLVLIAITVVALTQVVGIVLVMTMLTLPQLLASLFCHKLSLMIFWSVLISMICTTAGLGIAYFLDWPAGASIALVSIVLYLAGMSAKHAVLKWGKTG
jgi:zinc transport system permease protein